MLTNLRLIFFSKSKWLPRNVFIELDKVDLIEPREWIQHSFVVQLADSRYRFSGKGSKRIYERLILRRKALSLGQVQEEKQMEVFKEIIYLQGDIQIFIKGNLTTNGQVFFTSQKLKIDGYSSLFKRYPPFETTLQEISSFSYNLLNKSLSIEVPKRSISIMGEIIPKLYLLLIGYKEGGLSQDWNAKEITFNRGLLFIKGIASLSQKHFFSLRLLCEKI